GRTCGRPLPRSQCRADNTNLVVKGVVAMASFAQLLDRAGNTTEAALYRQWAASHVAYLRTHAGVGSGGSAHLKRQYELSDATWSLKYNSLVSAAAAWRNAARCNASHRAIYRRPSLKPPPPPRAR